MASIWRDDRQRIVERLIHLIRGAQIVRGDVNGDPTSLRFFIVKTPCACAIVECFKGRRRCVISNDLLRAHSNIQGCAEAHVVLRIGMQTNTLNS